MKFAVLFSASWCYPCQKVESILSDIVEQYNIEIYDVDIDDPDVAEILIDFKVQGVPTLLFFDEEQEPIKRLVGAQNAQTIIEAFYE